MTKERTNRLADGFSAIAPAYDAGGNCYLLASACSNNVLRVANTYDHQSRRIKKAVAYWNEQTQGWGVEQAHTFLYDGWNPILETIGNHQLLTCNVEDKRSVDEFPETISVRQCHAPLVL